MRRFLLGIGSVLVIVGLITVESMFLHPIPSLPMFPASPSSKGTKSEETMHRVRNLLSQRQFTTQESTEDTLLQQVAAGEIPTTTLVLLAENDRSGLLSWMSSTDAHLYFSALKEALSSTFSPDLQDLRDDREELPGKRTRDILSFRDPALSAERITIILVGDTLYEFHISPGHDERLAPLIEALTVD